MNENLIDISDLGLSEEELFAHVENSTADAEKITAPRYSYWRSVLRVFFKKKINIVILSVLAILIVFYENCIKVGCAEVFLLRRLY